MIKSAGGHGLGADDLEDSSIGPLLSDVDGGDGVLPQQVVQFCIERTRKAGIVLVG